jgi:hypothetical protein
MTNSVLRVRDVDSNGLDFEHTRRIKAEVEKFPELDRNQENKDIIEFQKTKDLKILEKAFKNRIPTLKVWANQNFYPGLVSSVEDLYAELSYVFVKAAHNYDINRGSFNTLLYTFFLNRIKNIKSSKHAKKRKSNEWTGPLNSMLLSLDYSYNDKDGSLLTLKDLIASEPTNDKAYISKNVTLDETIRILSSDDPVLKSFFMKLSEGDSMAALLKEYRTKKGEICLDKRNANKLKRYKCNKIVSDMIKDKVNGEFKLVEYEVGDTDKLSYQVEMKKTEETDKIIRAIRDIKKNKESFVTRIKGEEIHN